MAIGVVVNNEDKQKGRDDILRADYKFDAEKATASFATAHKAASAWAWTEHNYYPHEASICRTIAEFILTLIPPNEAFLIRKRLGNIGGIVSAADLLPDSVIDWMGEQEPPIPLPHFGMTNIFQPIFAYFYYGGRKARKLNTAEEAEDMLGIAADDAKGDKDRSKTKRLAKWVLMAVDQGKPEIIEPRKYATCEKSWDEWRKTNPSFYVEPSGKSAPASNEEDAAAVAKRMRDAMGTPSDDDDADTSGSDHGAPSTPPIGGDLPETTGEQAGSGEGETQAAGEPFGPPEAPSGETALTTQGSNELANDDIFVIKPAEKPADLLPVVAPVVANPNDWWFTLEQHAVQPKQPAEVSFNKKVRDEIGVEDDRMCALIGKFVKGKFIHMGFAEKP